jgi:hypothetical protein
VERIGRSASVRLTNTGISRGWEEFRVTIGLQAMEVKLQAIEQLASLRDTSVFRDDENPEYQLRQFAIVLAWVEETNEFDARSLLMSEENHKKSD